MGNKNRFNWKRAIIGFTTIMYGMFSVGICFDHMVADLGLGIAMSPDWMMIFPISVGLFIFGLAFYEMGKMK